ncbi:MAG: hypothetical protein NTW19_24545 [Planctomycetota bacterium]|nr:hypothetical protein [Planctomycetota bacterium]
MTASIDLSGLWRFQPDPHDEGERRGFFRPGHDAQRWLEVNVPAPFDAAAPSLVAYEGMGWYRREIVLPPASVPGTAGGEAAVEPILRFEGVTYNTRVWLNGQAVGEHQGGFLPFEMSLAPAARAGVNVLVVRADSTRRDGAVPGPRRGWRPFGGILREVVLEHRPLLRLDRPAVTARGDGSFTAHVRVVNHSGRERRVQVEMRVTPLGGSETVAVVRAQTLTIPAGARETAHFAGSAPEAKPWSPESPALHIAGVRLFDIDAPGCPDDPVNPAKPVDEARIAFGFRTIEARDARLFLNGQPLRFAGFNRHEDTPRAGMTPDPHGVRADLLHMKSLGANFVRLCHYPHHPSTLDLCDELGMLAMGEIPLYWWGGPEGETSTSVKLAAAEGQLREMIARDVNHPSLIFWSVSNETSESHPDVASGNAQLVALARELDPSRLAVHVSDRWPNDPHFEQDQTACLNGYPSLAAVMRQPDAANPFAEGTRWWNAELERLHASHPELPIVIAEFGYSGLAGVLDGRSGEGDQMEAIRAEAEAFQKPYVCGMVIWCYADHPWPEEPFLNRVTTSPYGVLTRDRRPKLAMAHVPGLFKRFRGV